MLDPDPAILSIAQVSHLFTAEVMDFIPITLKRVPRLSEPCPLGMSAEQWYDFGTQAGDTGLFSLVIAYIATTSIKPGHATRQTHREGHRPLLMTSFLRRHALKLNIAAKKPSVIAAAGPPQDGVPGWSQQDDQVHPILRGSRPNPSPCRPHPQGCLTERVQTLHAAQSRVTGS